MKSLLAAAMLSQRHLLTIHLQAIAQIPDDTAGIKPDAAAAHLGLLKDAGNVGGLDQI